MYHFVFRAQQRAKGHQGPRRLRCEDCSYLYYYYYRGRNTGRYVCGLGLQGRALPVRPKLCREVTGE